MPYKFQENDPVFHKGAEGYTTISGFYTVQEISKDGTIYRVVDSQGGFTDADEDELEHVLYAVFVHTTHGMPIIVPVYDKELYTHFLSSNLYKFVCESTAKGCIEEQTNILKKLDEQATG